MKEKCAPYLPILRNAEPEVQDAISWRTTMTTYHCALYALAKVSSTGIPEHHLEKALEHCSTLPSSAWAFEETVKYAIESSNELMKIGTSATNNDDNGGEVQAEALVKVESILLGLIKVTECVKEPEKEAVYCKALQFLAQCHLEKCRSKKDDAELGKACEVLDRLDARLILIDDKRQYAQSLLFRLEMLEGGDGDFEVVNHYWNLYTNQRRCKAEDVDRIIRLLGLRKPKDIVTLTSDPVTIAAKVIDAILWDKDSNVQVMLGKLLLNMVKDVTNDGDFTTLESTLTLIHEKGNLELNVDVILACQSKLFEKGEQQKDARFFALAAHQLFHGCLENSGKAICKAAWTYLESFQYDDAHRMLKLAKKHFGDGNVNLLLVRCLVFIAQKEESKALEVLDLLLQNAEFGMDLIPLLLQKAQVAKMREFEIQALAHFARLGLTALKEEGPISYNLPVIVRTIIKLQVDHVEQRGGFNAASIASSMKLSNLALDIIEKAAAKNKEDDSSADIATWLSKVFYGIASDDKHAIEPSMRYAISNAAVQMISCRKDFDKELDQESYNVELWAYINMLTYQLQLARSIKEQEVESDEEKVENLSGAWNTVECLARVSLDCLQAAKTNTTNALATFKGVELPLIVSRAQALINMGCLELLKEFVEADVVKDHFDALQAVAHIVFTHHLATYDIRRTLIMKTLKLLWVKADFSFNGVQLIAAWHQRMAENALDNIFASKLTSAFEDWEHILAGICNDIGKDGKLKRFWPRDSLQWLYGQSWQLGMIMMNEHQLELGTNLLVLAVKISEIANDGTKQAKEMKDYLDYWQAERQAQGQPCFQRA